MINWCTKRNWKFGTNIGVISYDDTPLKEIISEGISVISNDFALMGKRAAQMILEKSKGRYPNDYYFIDRNSL
jgi:DNA-binding LacI/PurR family transcriptional regulator